MERRSRRVLVSSWFFRNDREGVRRAAEWAGVEYGDVCVLDDYTGAQRLIYCSRVEPLEDDDLSP